MGRAHRGLPKHTNITSLKLYLADIGIDGFRAPLYGSGNTSRSGVVGYLRWDDVAGVCVGDGFWDFAKCDGSEFEIGVDIVKIGTPTLTWGGGLLVTPSANSVFEGVRYAFLEGVASSTPQVLIVGTVNIVESSAAAASLIALGLHAANGECGAAAWRNTGPWQIGLIFGAATAPSFGSIRSGGTPGTTNDVKFRWDFANQDDGPTNGHYTGQVTGGSATGGAAISNPASLTTFGLGADGDSDGPFFLVGLGPTGSIAAKNVNLTVG